jgi:hypothetical protein
MAKPRKQKQTNKTKTSKHSKEDKDLFSFVEKLLQRQLTDKENETLVSCVKTFVGENIAPTDVYDEDQIREEAELLNERGRDEDEEDESEW